MKNGTLQILVLTFILQSCNEPSSVVSSVTTNNEVWTESNEKAYVTSQFDSTMWDMELLQDELKPRDNDESWPTQEPMLHIPYPVAKYRAGYTTKSISMEIGDKKIKGGSYAAGTMNEYLKPLCDDQDQDNFIFFNILVLTDMPEPENSMNSVISRNYPNHTCQGRRKTSIGNIDWIGLHLATNESLALVSTKYFNLKYGETILVAPQKDGSLRFMQVDLPNVSTREIDAEIDKLKQRKEVIEFFTDKNVI